MRRSDSDQASRRTATLSAAAIAVAVCGALMHAQAPPGGATVWDGAYTEAQAARAVPVFAQSCSRCHTLTPDGTRPLSGDKFWQSYTQKTVGDLLTYIRTAMPNGNPGSLPDSTYNDLVALILRSNGFPAGAAEVAADTVAALRIVPKDGSSVLPANTLVGVVGCLARAGSEWVLTSATAPDRIDKTGARPGDATRELGTGTMALKFALTRLDPYVGQRLSVSGMLLGAGGSDGLNVAAVERVAEACP